MKIFILPFLTCAVFSASAWSTLYYPARVPRALVRNLAPPPLRYPHYSETYEQSEIEDDDEDTPERPKREHQDDFDKDFFQETPRQEPAEEKDFYQEPAHHQPSEDKGITGPVHTFVKTDKNANYKWGVRHHVGNKYAS